MKLAQIIYGQVCKSLTDSHEGVRLTALKLVWVLVLQYPEQYVILDVLNISLVFCIASRVALCCSYFLSQCLAVAHT